MSAVNDLYTRWGVSEQGDNIVNVPREVFNTLVLLALGRVNYSEDEYLSRHQDVKKAVARGDFASGWMHFLWVGLKENRKLGDADVDPKRYLELNRDLANIFDENSHEDLINHWKSVGWAEGRLR